MQGMSGNFSRPPLCAPGSHDQPVPCPGLGSDKLFPGHALHEKGLQRQIGVGTLVNSQQRRALAVPVTNRWSTAGHPLVNRTFCSSTGLHRISFVRSCDLSSPKPGHTRGGSGRHGARRTVGRGEAGQNRLPTFRSAQEANVPPALQGAVNNCSERLFASTNKGNPM